MKRFILIAGIGFYVLTFVTIFAITFFMFDVSRPANAYVLNVNTKDLVWQENMEAFDLYWATRMSAISDPSHNDESFGAMTDARDKLAEGEELAPMSYDIEVAYGAYHDRLFSDGDREAQAPLVSEGDQAYTEAVCWHCHSQFVRPLAYEQYRWGPVSQVAESAHENPTRFGTRRIGPDLTREGNRRPDEWHYAHFFNPRYTVPQSIMARYGGVSRYWNQVSQDRIDELQSIASDAAEGMPEGEYKNIYDFGAQIFNTAIGLMDDAAAEGDEVWVLHKGTLSAAGFSIDESAEPVLRVVPKPKDRIRNLTAYVQTRGLTIGKTKRTDSYIGGPADVDGFEVDDQNWQRYIRKLEFVSGRWRRTNSVARPDTRPEYVLAPAELLNMEPDTDSSFKDPEWMEFRGLQDKYDLSMNRGKNLFMAKCAGCHGGLDFKTGLPIEVSMADRDSEAWKMVGNGYGPAAQWMSPEPRNLHLAALPRKAMKKVTAEDGTVSFEETDRELTPRERGTHVGLYKNRSGHPDSFLARPEDIYQTLRNGMAPSSMPAWPFLTDWEVWDLVNFVMYLGDGEGALPATVAFGIPYDDAKEGLYSYWNINEVDKAFSLEVQAPDLALKPSNDSTFQSAKDDEDAKRALIGAGLEAFAAGYWKSKLGDAINLDGSGWDTDELVAIGRAIYTGEHRGARGGTLECATCHGQLGDSWAARRGDLFFSHGFAARNYYTGQFKIGGSRDGIYRAMHYGVANTLMTSQMQVATRENPNSSWSALEAIAIAEFVLDKSRQGVYGITDDLEDADQ